MILALLLAFGIAPLPAASSVATLTGTGSKSAAAVASGVIVDIGGQTSFYAAGSATPTWQAPPTISFQSIVDGGGATLASLRFEQDSSIAPRIPTLRRYTPASATPTWTYRFPFQVTTTTSGLHVSRDGQTLVAWVFTFQAKPAINPAPSNGMVVDVAEFSSGSGVPGRYFSVYVAGQPSLSALSDDGRSLLLVSGIKRVLLDTQLGTVRDDGWNTASIGHECALSADGSSYAVARSRRYVDVWQGQNQAPTLDVGTDAVWCEGLKFSQGALAVGWSSGRIDIGGGQINAPAPLVDFDISPDGNLLAEIAGGPTVYERAGSSWSKTFEQNVPGTSDVDVSDSSIVTVGAGRVDLFRRGAAPMPVIEYRLAISQTSAVPGSIHTVPGFDVATGQPNGSSITVKVQ